jgi:hypothetical protein
MTKTELRRYARESGIHTRLSRRRIMLHEEDIKLLVEWVRQRKNADNDWAAVDPFA